MPPLKFILSFDGGGVKCLMALEIIKAIEDKRPGFLERVDCCIGSSSGGLTAALLSMNKTANLAEILAVFQNNMKQIFKVSFWHRLKTLNGLIRPLYQNKNLKLMCQTFFQHINLEETSKDLMIWSYDIKRNLPYLYLNNVDCCSTDSIKELPYPTITVGPLYQPVYHTCLAPSYFKTDHGMTDGSLFLYNPSGMSLIALSNLQPNVLENTCLLSFGYTTIKTNFNVNGGSMSWLNGLSTIFTINSSQSHYISEHLLKDRYFRIEIDTNVNLDSKKSYKKLKRDAQKWIDQHLNNLLLWVDKYVMTSD